jgi:hypothetical protein
MKNILIEMSDKILLRKQSIIETVNDELKKYLSNRTFKASFLRKFYFKYIGCNSYLLFLSQKPAIRFDNPIDLLNPNY